MKVKQLEWTADDADVFYADGLFGTYCICPNNHGYGNLWSSLFNDEYPVSDDEYDGEFNVNTTVEKAKESCQYHHEKRVKQALKYVECVCSTQQ